MMEIKPQTKFKEFLETFYRARALAAHSSIALDDVRKGTDFYFCTHFEYEPIRISAWMIGHDTSLSALFAFDHTGLIEEIKHGEYTEAEVAEMRAIIDQWLAL